MIRIFWTLLLFFSCVAWQAESTRNWEEDIYSLLDQQNSTGALEVLEEWKADNGENNPQYWVAGGNIWFQIAFKPTLEITELPYGKYKLGSAKGKELTITNPKTGDVVGKIGEGEPVIDTNAMKKALSFLDEGVRRNPHRLDIFTGRAHLYRTMGDLKGELIALESLAKDPKPKNGKYETGPGRILEGEIEDYQVDMLASYAREHLQMQNEADDRAGKAVAELLIKIFPKRPHGYNFMGALASYEGNWTEVKKWLLLALEQDPDDSLVIANLGYCYEKLGDTNSSIEQYKRVINLNNNPEQVKRAKAKLTEFEPEP